MKSLSNNGVLVLLISIIAGLIFIPFIGNCPLFDWDEVNFAECAREMVVSGDYSHVQLNFRPFWEKPPFFIWLQAISMNIFGVNEFAARFPNAVCSIITLVSIFIIGSKFHSRKFGLTWVLLYASTLLPHLYFKSGLIDPWFNLFIFLSIYHCIRFINNPNGRRELLSAVFAGIFLGLAVLTKGPAALVIAGLTIFAYYAWIRDLKNMFTRPMIVFIISSILVAGSWFLVELAKGNENIISEFIDYQVRLFETGDAGHSGPFLYHFIVLLIGCFPSSVFFIISYFKYRELTPYQRLFRKIFISLFWVVLIIFSFAQTKIIHYSSLCYFPLTFVATIGLVQYFETLKLRGWINWLFWVITIIFTMAFILIGFTEQLKEGIINSGMITDKFAVHNLQANVHWTGLEFLIGIVFLAGAFLVYFALKKHKFRLLVGGLIVNLLFIYLAIAVIIPKVELYSQHAAIEFYKTCAKHHCYVETHGFKSYAYLFYSNRTKNDYINPDQVAYIEEQLDVMEKEGHSRLSSYPTSNLLWMEHGKIDRPAYIVIKTKDEEDLYSNKEMLFLYRENGFSFFVRLPQAPAK
jgi:hypothetical protein